MKSEIRAADGSDHSRSLWFEKERVLRPVETRTSRLYLNYVRFGLSSQPNRQTRVSIYQISEPFVVHAGDDYAGTHNGKDTGVDFCVYDNSAQINTDLGEQTAGAAPKHILLKCFSRSKGKNSSGRSVIEENKNE